MATKKPAAPKATTAVTPVTVWVVRAGLRPLAGIGPGPLSEAEYLAQEADYMAGFPAGSPTPRDRGVYVPAPVAEPPAEEPAAKQDEQPAQPGEEQ